MIIKKDALQFLKEQKDYSSDIIFCDPPYALGSKIIIKENGKVDYKKAVDFMDKWDMPTGEFWEEWFREAFRSLKYGGHLIMYGIDRQLLLPKYYASLAGFTEKQSIYWYFISSFPKASDLSKNIDKRLGVDVKEYGGIVVAGQTGKKHLRSGNEKRFEKHRIEPPLAKKYSGYKYSIAPLKQTNETIMVFQKPYKTGSCLHDTLEMEQGDDTCTCGALDINGNRCGVDGGGWKGSASEFWGTDGKENMEDNNQGRYPAQTYVNSQAGERLDEMSGVKTGSGKIKYASETNRKGLTKDNPVFNTENSGIDTTKSTGLDNYGDTGGCSKVLHKCDYEEGEYDIYHYNPKVSKSERNAGEGRFAPIQVKNNHPTVKPISLNEKILKLFKTPNEQRILIPFAGSGSEIIGAIKAGYTNIEGCEINPEYIKIAEARIKYWSEKWKIKQLKIIDDN
jgi:hypothetical protein